MSFLLFSGPKAPNRVWAVWLELHGFGFWVLQSQPFYFQPLNSRTLSASEQPGTGRVSSCFLVLTCCCLLALSLRVLEGKDKGHDLVPPGRCRLQHKPRLQYTRSEPKPACTNVSCVDLQGCLRTWRCGVRSGPGRPSMLPRAYSFTKTSWTRRNL